MMTIPEEMIIAVGWAIIHSIWQFGILALLLKGILQFVPTKKSALRYSLSLGTLLIGVLLFTITVFIEWQATSTIEISNVALLSESIGESIEQPYFPIEGIETRHAELTPTTTFDQMAFAINNHSRWIVIFWMIGMLLFTIRFFNAYFFLNNLKKIGVECNEKYQAKVDLLKQQLGITKPVQFLLSHIAEQPMTFGFLKPVILIPFSLVSQLSPEQLEVILLHELSHIKRNDYLINIFQSLMEIIFFYHPAVWWISGLIRKVREEACDDQVIASGKDPFLYAQTLLNTKKHIFNNSKTHLAMNATNSNPNHFTQRIYRIMAKEKQLKSYTPASKPLMALIVVLCVFILSACTSLAVGGKKVVSVSADKMNVLYIGVDNPITLAVSNTDYKDLKITCEGGGLEVRPVGDGKYIARVTEPTSAAKLIIKGKGFKEEMNFRVKRIPTPMPSLHSLEEYNDPNITTIASSGGNINAEQFKTHKGVVSVLENFEFEAECIIEYYEVTRVPAREDAMRTRNVNSEFEGRSIDLIQAAKEGDIYYFDQIKCKCPGDAAARKIAPMVWHIN